jgi:hypothetical protein
MISFMDCLALLAMTNSILISSYLLLATIASATTSAIHSASGEGIIASGVGCAVAPASAYAAVRK